MGDETGTGGRFLKRLLGAGGILAGIAWLALHLGGAALEVQVRALGVGLILATIVIFLCCALPQRGAPPFRKRKLSSNLPFDIPLVGIEPQNGAGQPVPVQQDPSAAVPHNGTTQTPPVTYYATNVSRLHFAVDLGERGEDVFDVACPVPANRIAEMDLTVDPAPPGSNYQRRYTVVLRHSPDTSVPLTSSPFTIQMP